MKRILLVDDHPDIRRLIRLSLGKSFEIIEADNAVTALESARTSPPDAMILDVMMPGEFDGLGLLDLAKADPVLKHIPVIMVTARGQEQDKIDAMARGAAAYVIKPFSPLQLSALIRDLLPSTGSATAGAN